MQPDSLRAALAAGPSQFVEFLPEPATSQLAETLIAMANADGGTILVGVHPSGRVSDSPAEGVEALLQRAQSLCRPPVSAGWRTLSLPGGEAVAITVRRGQQPHRTSDGRILVRSGLRNRELSPAEAQQMEAARGGTSYEEQPLPGATLDDLDPAVIAEFAAKRAERAPRGERLEGEELLVEVGALGLDGMPTVAGMLLFGRRPQRFVEQSSLIFVRFAGSDPRGPGGLPGYGRREEIGGPLARVIEGAWRVVWEEMRHEAVIPGLAREERPEYPPFAVREALVNAVCHRDYSIKGLRVEIRMFDDRLEVVSPGGLPGHITLDNIVEEHYSRNPRIVRGLYYWGYIEELGLGVDRMIEEMVRDGHPAPEFASKPHAFNVVLRNARERASAEQWNGNLNPRQLQALRYVQEHRRITNREYRELCPDVSPETIRLDLANLVDQGMLLRIGDKKGTYYILK
ncbi:MAG TPA: ATP-binding protein [Anaerolineae bacterium]|nr:ATP-binding protein [Anaerolineae bacterium]HPL26636.1 ATP-binding protein [Anaerolineae bacterium]